MPLVQNKVVSDFQLGSAKAAYEIAKGNIEQAKAQCSHGATHRIIGKLGDNGYVENLTIDYHAGKFGTQSLSSSTGELSRLAGGYAGDASTCYLGQCWAGRNAALASLDFTVVIINALDGATTYGNQAAASSIAFAFHSHFIGVIPESYSKDPDNLAAVGTHTVAGRVPTTGTATIRTITNVVHISNFGQIKEH